MNIRDIVATCARTMVGLGDGPEFPEQKRQQYRDRLFPLDRPEQRAALARDLSSCAIAGLICYQECGATEDFLLKPYASRMGRAVSEVVLLGQRTGSWHTVDDKKEGGPINTGDLVLIGDNGAWGFEHVLIVLSYDWVTGKVLSVDGGQGGRGHYNIAERERYWHMPEGQPAQLIDSSTATRGRKVMGWVNCEQYFKAKGIS